MTRQIAYVVLDEEVAVDMAAVAETLRARHPDVAIEALGQSALRCDGEAILVTPMGFPLPRSEWELPCRRAGRMWLEAQTVFESHASHIIVTTVGESTDKLHSAKCITAVVGGIIAAAPGCWAVLWEAQVAHPAQRWLDMSRQAFAPYPRFPYFLWVSIHPFKDGATLGAITFGLSPFVGRELELEMRNASAAEVIDKAAGLAVYLLQHGAVIGDGHTAIGSISGMQMSVRHAISRRVAGLPVLRATPLAA